MSERYTKDKAADCLRKFFLANCPTQYLLVPPEKCLMDEQLRRVNVTWEASWGVSCSLSFGIDNEPNISWSSTGRTVVTAVAAIALYRTVVEFAAMLEARRQEELGYVHQSDRRYAVCHGTTNKHNNT